MSSPPSAVGALLIAPLSVEPSRAYAHVDVETVAIEGMRCYRAATGYTTPALVLSTAHPAKFPEAVRHALGTEPATPEALAALEGRPVRVETIPPTSEALKGFL